MSTPSSRYAILVRILDYFSVLAFLLTLTVLVTGGFREWLPWGRISVTSWSRPLVLALVAVGVRHWIQPRPTIVSRLGATVRAVMAAAGVRDTLPIFIVSRGSVLLVGLLAVTLFGFRDDAGPPWRLYQNQFLNLPARWDTGWYLGIAAGGYEFDPAFIDRQQNIAFFPAFPMLMRYGGMFLGRELMWTGVLISWLSFFGALIYLHRFTRDRFGGDAAHAAVALIACYPYALFFSTAYTEALFLLTILGACYHFEREELGKAGAWGLLAGLTRPNGCLLSVVLALIAIRPLWIARTRPAAANWSAAARRIAVASLPGIGMLMYSAHVYFLTGNPLQWAAQNAAWGRVYRGLDVLVADQAAILDYDALFDSTATLEALQLAAVVFVLASAWPVYRRLGLPYAAMILVNVVPPLLMGGLLSMGRVTSVLFPAFVWLGLVVPARHRTAWVTAFAMVQALCAAVFFTWRPLF